MSLKFLIVSVLLLLSASLATSDKSIDHFLQCLLDHNRNESIPISDAIYTTNSSAFESTLLAHLRNCRFSTPLTLKPLAIIAAKHEPHVQATVICAKSNGLQIRIRSGGHDYDGLSYISDFPFVILDMFNLRSIDIDIPNETAWLQAGATVGELYYSIAKKSNVHAFPAGVCFTLGAGGHISGGGYGNMMRKYGLSVDNIVDAQLVDVKGKILDRKAMGEDLFWAIRGGGGASFGVILSWKISLVKVTPIVTTFTVSKTLQQGATDLVYRWQQVATTIDKELYIRVMLQVVNGSSGSGKKTVSVSFIALFLGDSSTLLPLMKKRFPELGLQRKDCNEMSWVQSTLYWFGVPTGTPIDILINRPSPASFFKRKSDYVKHIIPKEGLERIWKMLIMVDPMYMQWNPYGGRMSEVPATATPFPHRAGYLFKIHYSLDWSEERVEATNHYMNLSRQMYDAMTPYASKNPREAFLNYRDVDIGSNPSNQTDFAKGEVYGTKYFKGNFPRLVRVKSRVDPDNFFKNEQSIPVALA